MTRTQEPPPRKVTEPGPSTSGASSLLDEWDLLFDQDGASAPATITEIEAIPTSTATRYLGFRVGAQLYAVPLAELTEVIRDAEITAVPRLRPFVKGIVSVRGTIVPIVDLKRRLAVGGEGSGASLEGGDAEGQPLSLNASQGPADRVLPGARSGASQRRILVTSFGGEFYGLLVDEVTHPFALEPHEVEPPPVTLPRRLHEIVQGIGLVADRIHILLDLSVVLRFDAVLPQSGRVEGAHD